MKVVLSFRTNFRRGFNFLGGQSSRVKSRMTVSGKIMCYAESYIAILCLPYLLCAELG